MIFIKEYAAGTYFPSELSYSCFFWIKQELFGLPFHSKRLYKCSNGTISLINLFREYIKIVPNSNGTDFFAYTQLSNRNEIDIYHLDNHFKELDCLKVRKMAGNSGVVDLWFDDNQDFLYLVYPGSILKYNCNGDYLGIFMSATTDTDYCSMCTYNNQLFLAYKRNNCPHVGLYQSNGSFKEKISFGTEYQFLGMQVVTDNEGSYLIMHVVKNGEIHLFCELTYESTRHTGDGFNPCFTNSGKITYESQNELELVLGEGVGEATCHIKPHCHTSRLHS